jgi:hypothetical protein
LAQTKLQRIYSPLKNFFLSSKRKENASISLNQKGKPIAATPLIQFLGSIDLCNAKFDSLFNPHQAQSVLNSSNETSYLQLDNFKSGDLFKNEQLLSNNESQTVRKSNSRDQDKARSDYVNSDALVLGELQHTLPFGASDVDLFEFDHLINQNVNSDYRASNQSRLKYVPVEVVHLDSNLDKSANPNAPRATSDRSTNKENQAKSRLIVESESKSSSQENQSGKEFDKTLVETASNLYTDLDALRTDALKRTQLNK